MKCAIFDSGCVDRGDRDTLRDPPRIHRADPAAHRRQCRGARHVRVDGDEGQDGAHDRYLRRQLNCAHALPRLQYTVDS